MSDSIFQVGAKGVDVDAIVRSIRDTVADKKQKGVYDQLRVTRAERMNLAALRDSDQFLDLYLECLRDGVVIDMNDFEIRERRTRFPGLYIGLKKAIWNLLKFYTFRMWSQQNQANTLLLSAIEGVDEKYRDKIAALESRLAKLENRDSKP